MEYFFSHDKVSLAEGLVSLVPKLGFSELTFDSSHWTPGRSRYSLPSSRLPPPSKWCQDPTSMQLISRSQKRAGFCAAQAVVMPLKAIAV